MGLGWWRLVCAALAGTLFFYGFSHSEKAPNYSFMHEATTAPPLLYYDYVVIGGGTAGCALAATLSEGARVLVLERGGSPYGNANINNLALFANSLADLSPSSPSQAFVSEDGVFNARARVLGGGSALNAGFYSRASGEYVAGVGWDAQKVEEAYGWVEKKVVFEPPMLAWQTAVRDGLLEVGVVPNNGFTYDHLYGTKFGGTIFDGEGHRHTAADLLEYADPKGISVYLHATVQRILFRPQGSGRPSTYGVVFKDASGGMHRAFLNAGPNNEIILSAGALGSPQLLMLSGVGPSSELKAQGIDLVLDQPMVGQGMSDNPMNAVAVPSPQPVEASLIQAVGITRSDNYIEASSGLSFGPISPQNLPTQMGLLSNQSGQASKLPDPEQKTPEALPLLNTSFRGGIILEKFGGPLSTGYLKLRNRNPDDNPIVAFNYFEHPEDLKKCVDGMTTVIDLIQSKAFSKFRYPGEPVQALINAMLALPLNLRPKHLSASISLEQFCIDTVMTIWHYHGGCQVGRVVDRDYKVLGVDALRVIDGSTFYGSPGTNPQATVMMLGRYMGRRILSERNH